jgi:hypothetical protein
MPGRGQERVLIDNRTELPDYAIEEAVETYLIEHSSLMGMAQPSFSTYDGGGLMNRTKFAVPKTIVDEIKLARDLAERDDDIAATIGQMIGTAFGDGMENFHEEELTTTLFNQVAKKINLDGLLAEMYREWLIAQQFTTAHVFSRESYDYTPEGGDGRSRRQYSLATPAVGILPAENIRLIGSDLFRTAALAYDPSDNEALTKWLEEFFSDKTPPARKAELRREDPVSAALFIGVADYVETGTLFASATAKAYLLNPKMAARTTAAKGAWAHPRPRLTRNFALLEAKRLLNLMDHALLQGGVNFIIVAKKGNDARPAKPAEVKNLGEVVRRASRSGVIVGDHRLSFEVITPNLDALLSPGKRRLIGRKLAQGMLNVPEQSTEDAAQEGMKAELEFIARTINFDRHQIKRHVENSIYDEVANRNRQVFKYSHPKLWFPKIILQGTNYFTDFVLKLRDRGDIPRKWAVEAGGFDYEAGLAQRRREVERGDDETLMPAAVPFTNPQSGPQDNNSGRPTGTSPDNGRPGASPGSGKDPNAPSQTFTRNKGETVKAMYDEEHGAYRGGEVTVGLLESFAESAAVGRLSRPEARAVNAAAEEPTTVGGIHAIPVNADYEVVELAKIALSPSMSILVGKRKIDRAIVAKTLLFRHPDFDLLKAEETALTWGFSIARKAEELPVGS